MVIPTLTQTVGSPIPDCVSCYRLAGKQWIITDRQRPTTVMTAESPPFAKPMELGLIEVYRTGIRSFVERTAILARKPQFNADLGDIAMDSETWRVVLTTPLGVADSWPKAMALTLAGKRRGGESYPPKVGVSPRPACPVLIPEPAQTNSVLH